jgi:hypothetical protein
MGGNHLLAGGDTMRSLVSAPALNPLKQTHPHGIVLAVPHGPFLRE